MSSLALGNLGVGPFEQKRDIVTKLDTKVCSSEDLKLMRVLCQPNFQQVQSDSRSAKINELDSVTSQLIGLHDLKLVMRGRSGIFTFHCRDYLLQSPASCPFHNDIHILDMDITVPVYIRHQPLGIGRVLFVICPFTWGAKGAGSQSSLPLLIPVTAQPPLAETRE